jgi:hypothetical protein
MIMEALKDVRQFLQKIFPNEDRLWITHPGPEAAVKSAAAAPARAAAGPAGG